MFRSLKVTSGIIHSDDRNPHLRNNVGTPSSPFMLVFGVEKPYTTTFNVTTPGNET